MRRDKIACSCRNITYGRIADVVRNGEIYSAILFCIAADMTLFYNIGMEVHSL